MLLRSNLRLQHLRLWNLSHKSPFRHHDLFFLVCRAGWFLMGLVALSLIPRNYRLFSRRPRSIFESGEAGNRDRICNSPRTRRCSRGSSIRRWRSWWWRFILAPLPADNRRLP